MMTHKPLFLCQCLVVNSVFYVKKIVQHVLFALQFLGITGVEIEVNNTSVLYFSNHDSNCCGSIVSDIVC